MALLNPPELRASVIAVIALYLSQQRGQSASRDQIVNAVSPPSLSTDPKKHQLDAVVNLNTMLELDLASLDKERVKLHPECKKAAMGGTTDIAKLLRGRVLAPGLNSAAWGSQEGARDLTNALAWFLTFSPAAAPARMEGEAPSAKEMQEADFGPRHGDDDEASGWPISNGTRWNAFQRWACSLGFAWRSPARRLIPDPTPAVRDAIGKTFAGETTLDGASFIAALGIQIPVLESGAYRRFVEENWSRGPSVDNLTSATTDALRRLETSGELAFEDRADAPRVRRADGTTFSHVSMGQSR